MLIREGCKYNRSTTRVRELPPNPYKILERRPFFLPLIPFVAPATFVFPLVRPSLRTTINTMCEGTSAILGHRDTIKTSSIVPSNARLSIRSLTIPTMNGFRFLLVSQDFYQSITLVILYHGYHRGFEFFLFLFFF